MRPSKYSPLILSAQAGSYIDPRTDSPTKSDYKEEWQPK